MNMSINEKNLNLVLISAIIVFPWIFLVFQGLDILELGYWMVSYENFFKNPEIMPDILFGSWLTAYAGALVNLCFGDLGIIAFRIVFVLTLYLLLYVVYLLLSPFTTKKLLLYFLLLSEIFVNISTYRVMNYYIFTTLLFLFSLLFLYRGLTTNKLFMFFIAGVAVGLNIFIRLPNLLGIFLFLVIVYYELATGRFQYRQTLKKIAIFVSGCLFAVVSTLLFMKMIGHYDLYVDTIAFIFGLTGEGSSGHGSVKLLRLFMQGHYKAIKHGGFLFIILSLILLSGKYWADKKLNKLVILVLSVLLAFLIIQYSHINILNYYCVYSGIIGLLYGSLLWIAYKKFKESPEFGAIAFASFLIMEMIPLGSQAYKYQIIYGMYLAIPVVLIYLYSLEKIRFGHFNISEKSIRALRSTITVSIMAFAMIVMNYYRAPNGETKRWTMFYGVDHPHLRGVIMTKERAETLNELIVALNKYQKEFSYILTYEQISTVAYLSDLQPYINSTYPLFWTDDKVEKELKLASLKKTLPMVVRAKSDTTVKGWPKNYQPIDKTNKTESKVRAVLKDFLKRNGYKIVWKNKNFEILTPKNQ